MPLDLLQHARFSGPALPESFVRLDLEVELRRHRLLPTSTGEAGRHLQARWEVYRRKLRELVVSGGPVRVRNHVVEPLASILGYETLQTSPTVPTREGLESGGDLLTGADGAKLRVWSVGMGDDLDAPSRRGRAYRFSHTRVAQRVLLASGERIGLLTNGIELRILLCDPARPDSQIEIPIDPHWKRSRDVPDTYRLLLALCSPPGLAALAQILEKARLQQTRVTRELRSQARQAVEGFLQEVLDAPANAALLPPPAERDLWAPALWHEGLVVVYRLLFIFKLEASDDPARAFRFASTSLWRNSFSPSIALARYARAVLDEQADTGSLLEDGLRSLFRMFADGLRCTELNVRPLGGALFGPDATPHLSRLRWSERGVALLLDRLLWTPRGRSAEARQRVHYGSLDVEDLGRVYEALLELSPGVATERMCRLRRNKLEVVQPVARGERYRPAVDAADVNPVDEDAADDDNEADTPASKRVDWIEDIPSGRFYLRVGLGRKASGSFYTPHPFVRFLVEQTLGPLIRERSPHANPSPSALLALKVLDPAMGSGHFLVEACRYLAEHLYEACRLCDEYASRAEDRARTADTAEAREAAMADAEQWRQRVTALPDANDELVSYLPSRSPEGEESGLSQRRAEALCRRLIAIHCLYGVDVNPLAVELAKLALWLECHNEGMPLTFLDHRLVLGNSATGPLFEQLTTLPLSGQPLDDIFNRGLHERLGEVLAGALTEVQELDRSVGVSIADLEAKRQAKLRLEARLAPFRTLAAAWAGIVQQGGEPALDGHYIQVARALVAGQDLASVIAETGLHSHVNQGADALPFDIAFPEVFYPSADVAQPRGFDVALGNPPWDGIDTSNKEFYAAFDLAVLDLEGAPLSAAIEGLRTDQAVVDLREDYERRVTALRNATAALFGFVNRRATGESAATPDLFQLFAERVHHLVDRRHGRIGQVFPSAFHANEGATGLRQLYLEHGRLETCFSFENRDALFEIHRSFKFDVVVATRSGPTGSFDCAFYLHDPEWLFDRSSRETLRYTRDFIRNTTGDQLNLLELRSQQSVEIAGLMYSACRQNFGMLRRQWHVMPTEELHTSKQRFRTSPLAALSTGADDPRNGDVIAELCAEGVLPVCKGEHFHQFESFWGEVPTIGTTVARMGGKLERVEAARFPRFVFRRQASSTNERTVIVHLSAPGLLYFDSALPERDPALRPNARALALVALANTYSFDWIVRQLVAANLTFNFIDTVPVPDLEPHLAFLAHGALRLVAQSSAYADLWREQLGDAWREATPERSYPVLAGHAARWAVRASLDAVVAHLYGLDRKAYQRVLASFNHRSYPQAPGLCLEAFERLTAAGLTAFVAADDPYADIAPVLTLPRPAITYPSAVPVANEPQPDFFGGGAPAGRRVSRRTSRQP